jgi:hypothetical protein
VSNVDGGSDISVKRRLMMRRTLLIGVSFLIALSGSVWFTSKYFALEANAVTNVVIGKLWPRPTTQQVEIRKLRQLSGWFSRNCGHVRRHTDADAAIACALSSLKAGQRFYVSFDYVRIDSHGTIGLAADSNRTVYEVTTDDGRYEDKGELRNGVNVSVIRCETPPIELTSDPRNRYLTCHPD